MAATAQPTTAQPTTAQATTAQATTAQATAQGHRSGHRAAPEARLTGAWT
jgi:hypothetical protein